jgi:hypothetical protein
MLDKYAALMEVLVEKLASLPLCPQQIPNILISESP